MILFVDMDEVLADTFGMHLELYNEEFNENLTYEDCYGIEVWNAVPEERKESFFRQVYTKGFFRNLNPIKDSQDVLKELDQKYRVYVASAAMQFPHSLSEKNDWLDEYFPFIHWKRRILCGDKHILHGDLLIDDRAYNLETFQGRSLLFSSPHNMKQNGFERVNNWQEIANLLL
ncbi:MAG: 5'(3')-deoxyribonucleotidase [Flavobacteriaceae bacterium]|nr:5'(3')-deoxyribonucleotidase [Flavobacteriaceae bacterium]